MCNLKVFALLLLTTGIVVAMSPDLSDISTEDLLEEIQRRKVHTMRNDEVLDLDGMKKNGATDAPPADVLAWTRGQYSSCSDAKSKGQCLAPGGSGGSFFKMFAKRKALGESLVGWSKSRKNNEVVIRVCAKTCESRDPGQFCPQECEGNCAFKNRNLFSKHCELNRNVQLGMEKMVIPVKTAKTPTWKIQLSSHCRDRKGKRIWQEGFDASRGMGVCSVTLGQVSCPCSEGDVKLSTSEAERRIMSQTATLGTRRESDLKQSCATGGAYQAALLSMAQTQAVLTMLKCWKKHCADEPEAGGLEALLDDRDEVNSGWDCG